MPAVAKGGEGRVAAVFGRAEPQVFVRDVLAAAEFYRSKLGFKIEFLHGTPPHYGQVSRGQSALNLRCVSHPIPEPDVRDREELLSASIIVHNIEVLQNEYIAAGAVFFQHLTLQPWGARTLIIRDLDGNLLLFAE